MAFDFIYFDAQSQFGRKLRRMLDMMEEADDAFTDVRDVMIKMCDGGDPSNAANFTEVAARFGFVSNAKAKAAFDELDSAYSKTSGNGTIDNVRAARDQLFSKLRG